MGKVMAVCISERKGTVKQDVGQCRIMEDYGLEQDAHAGSARQVSLLSYEKVEEFKQQCEGRVAVEPGIFGENLLVSGYDFKTYPVGTRFACGDVLLEITQIGKKCHTGCEIARLTGDCIMPREGVFAKVLRGGIVKNGDVFRLAADRITEAHHFKAAVITASDRAYRKEREDASGPLLAESLAKQGYEVEDVILLPDDEEMLYQELVRLADERRPDVIFTTGGTGLSPRDVMPEATLRAGEKNVPGIAEAVRAYSMTKTPHAMLSRAVSMIRGRTLIINLPGSPKAVRECLEFVIPVLAHGIGILRGEDDN